MFEIFSVSACFVVIFSLIPMRNHYEHVTDDDLKKWVEQFDRDGYLFLPGCAHDEHIEK